MNRVLNKISKTSYIQKFDSYPGDYRFYCISGETTNLFYGIELELSGLNKTCYQNLSFINTNFIFTSYEGSVNPFGIEFKNHPASFRFLKRNWIQWYNIFKQETLVANDTCGIHIHLSKEAFNEDILFRFIKFIYDNEAFTLGISGRVGESYKTWCYIECKGDLEYLRKVKYTFSDFFPSGSKSEAITVNQEGKTVEVRIFASTNNRLLFWKNLEFCDCLYYFCKYILSNNDLTIRNFINYLSFRRNRYKNLYKFIMANFCSEITGVVGMKPVRDLVSNGLKEVLLSV